MLENFTRYQFHRNANRLRGTLACCFIAVQYTSNVLDDECFLHFSLQVWASPDDLVPVALK